MEEHSPYVGFRTNLRPTAFLAFLDKHAGKGTFDDFFIEQGPTVEKKVDGYVVGFQMMMWYGTGDDYEFGATFVTKGFVRSMWNESGQKGKMMDLTVEWDWHEWENSDDDDYPEDDY
jgi:hypothetical protein